MNKLNRLRSGSIMVMTIFLLSCAFIVSIYLGSSVIDKTIQTQRSTGGDQAASLADAGVSRAVRMLAEQVNDNSTFTPESVSDSDSSYKNIDKSKSLGLMLRYPLPIKKDDRDNPRKDNPSSVGLGDDEELDVTALKPYFPEGKIELTLDDLRLMGKGEDWLDQLVDFASGEKVKDFDLKVTVSLAKAFRITPKPLSEATKYEVPGVDIEFSTKPEILSFLDNKGHSIFMGEFPEGLKLFDFTIPIQVYIPIFDKTITLAKIDPAAIVDIFLTPLTKKTKLAEEMGKSAEGLSLNDFFSLHLILKGLASLFEKEHLYPYIGTANKDFFTSLGKLWPSGVTVPADYGSHVEKYGTVKFVSVAKINFKDGTTSERRIEATKEFKVSDIMPMAPLYSLFIANIMNDRFSFNNLGGQVYINNNSKRLFSKEEVAERKEHSGQIRVNFIDEIPPKDDPEEKGTPILVNVGFIGNMDGPKMFEGGFADAAMNIVGGADGLMMLNPLSDMVLVKAKYNLDLTVNSKNVNTKKPVPKELKFSRGKFNHGFSMSSEIFDKSKFLNKDPLYIANRKKYQDSALKKRNDSYKWWSKSPYDWGDKNLKKMQKASEKLNFIPNPEKYSSNIISFGIATALDLAQANNPDSVPVSFGSSPSETFASMEFPWMGTSNDLYPLPTMGFGSNKTHLFGISAWYPTLSRDIEGFVAKRYRSWKFTIIGLFSKDRLPLLPMFPPPFCFVPPIPVPYWSTTSIINKYDYNLWFMKSLDMGIEGVEGHKADGAMSVYDPSDMVNMPANFYSVEQYAKKSNYYYASYDDFIKDLPKRMVQIDGKMVLQLNGVTFIAGSLGTDGKPFKITPEILNAIPGGVGKNSTDSTLYVSGRGMIVVSGNIVLDCDIRYAEKDFKNVDEKKLKAYEGLKSLKNLAKNPTVFSLIARNGGLAMPNKGSYILEGSYFTNRGIYLGNEVTLNIQGNWVTNEFSKERMRGELMVDYVSSKVRPSLGSLHPKTGKYDPRRYHLALSQKWNAWKVD